jgi:hypothetical protein
MWRGIDVKKIRFNGIRSSKLASVLKNEKRALLPAL